MQPFSIYTLIFKGFGLILLIDYINMLLDTIIIRERNIKMLKYSSQEVEVRESEFLRASETLSL